MDPVAAITESLATDAARSVELRRHWYSPASAAYAATRPGYLQSVVDAVAHQPRPCRFRNQRSANQAPAPSTISSTPSRTSVATQRSPSMTTA